MSESIITCCLLLIFQKHVSSFGHFGHLDLESYSDPRFLNSDFQFKSLGLFHPNSEGFQKHDSFGEGKKELNGKNFFMKHGIFDENVDQGTFGGFNGESDVKNAKGEYGYFFDTDGNKNEHLDGNDYYGKKHFDSEGKLGEDKIQKQGHRKGHKIRSFSTSHDKHESGKAEELYDEDHDEADNRGYDAKSGDFAEDSSSSFKGGHKDEEFKVGEVKSGVNFDKGETVKKTEGDQKHFGENSFGQTAESFAEHKEDGDGGLSEFNESINYGKHHPSFYD